MEYRIIDLRSGVIDAEKRVVTGAKGPEEAVMQALGLDVVRSGVKRNLVARVYWQRAPGEPQNMLRLYSKVEGGRERRVRSREEGHGLSNW